MLLCNETVTLIRLQRTDDGEEYLLTKVAGASWYGKRVIAQTTKGAEPQNTYTVRIPQANMPKDVIPRRGDFVVRGMVEEVKRAPADFVDREYFCITSVGDNRRGRPQMRHWAVSGS